MEEGTTVKGPAVEGEKKPADILRAGDGGGRFCPKMHQRSDSGEKGSRKGRVVYGNHKI